MKTYDNDVVCHKIHSGTTMVLCAAEAGGLQGLKGMLLGSHLSYSDQS